MIFIDFGGGTLPSRLLDPGFRYLRNGSSNTGPLAGWLLLNSRSGREEKQLMESESQGKDLPG